LVQYPSPQNDPFIISLNLFIRFFIHCFALHITTPHPITPHHIK